jgi:hypothetical protein
MLLECEQRLDVVDPRVELVARQPGEEGEADERIARPPARIDRDQLRQVADPLPFHEVARRHPVDRDRAVGRRQEPEQHRQHRRLPGAVRPGDAEDLAGPHRERHPLDGADFPAEERRVGLSDVSELDHRI